MSDTPETNEACFNVFGDQTGVVISYFARRLERQRNAYLNALMQIEEAFIDGDDTYDSWKKMGDIARNALKNVNFT